MVGGGGASGYKRIAPNGAKNRNDLPVKAALALQKIILQTLLRARPQTAKALPHRAKEPSETPNLIVPISRAGW